MEMKSSLRHIEQAWFLAVDMAIALLVFSIWGVIVFLGALAAAMWFLDLLWW